MNAAPQLIEATGWALLHFIWQGSLIALVLAVLLRLLNNARPQTRYALACVALLLCLAEPLGYVCLHLAHAVEAPAATAPASAPATAAVWHAAGIAAYLQAHLPALVWSWAACVVVLAVRLCLGVAWVRRHTHTGAVDRAWQERLDKLALRLGVRRAVRLRLHAGFGSPLAVGWWRPVVLLPAALLTNMPADLLEALLAHELAHIRRHDYLINLLQTCIETVLFYHPAIWWISRQIRQEREHIADDLAASMLGEPRRLALALQRLDLIRSSTPQLALAAQGGSLMFRIQRLIKPEVHTVNWKAAVTVCGLAVACIGMAAHAPAGSTPERARPAPRIADREKPAIDFDRCRPEYPKISLLQKETGYTTMEVLVKADGSVGQSKVTRSSGFDNLDNAVSSAVARCRGEPKVVAGKPVDAWIGVQYVWRLD